MAMLERFKSAINKIFILNNCKNKIIFKIIIVKIILLIRNNVNDIKYQKPQKLSTSMRFLTLYNPISDWVKFTKVWKFYGDLGRFSISFQVEEFDSEMFKECFDKIPL